jgi:hypothetical protein
METNGADRGSRIRLVYALTKENGVEVESKK